MKTENAKGNHAQACKPRIQDLKIQAIQYIWCGCLKLELEVRTASTMTSGDLYPNTPLDTA